MDRPKTKEQKRKEMLKPLVSWGCAAVGLGIMVWGVASWLEPSVDLSHLRVTTAYRGNLEITLNATGIVVPGSEQVIVSPISTRILEVFKREGDIVDAGEQLMALDLRNVENEMANFADEQQLKEYELTQTHLDNTTYLSNLQMQVKVKEMEVDRLGAQLESERRLDSLGSGTGEKVREAELAYSRGKLELKQLREQLGNEAKSRDASEQMKQIELSIHRKNRIEKARTVQDARIEAPRRSTITFLRNTLGEQIAQGEKLAILADLTSFKIDASIADTYSGALRTHAPAYVKIENKTFRGTVSNITAQSRNGTLAFEVIPDSLFTSKEIRPGVKAEVYIVDRTITDAVLIEPGIVYKGPGVYDLYVEEADGKLHRRKVQLGEGNFNYVTVISGIQPGERVVVSDLSGQSKEVIKPKQ